MRPPHSAASSSSRPASVPRAVVGKAIGHPSSRTILGVLAVSSEPSVKWTALCSAHAHTVFLPPRSTADASTAWRPSPDPEPQPRTGTLTGAAAHPRPGRALTNAYSAAAALSDTPGIARAAIGGAQPNDPAAWGYAARSPTAGKIWRTTPPSRADTSVPRRPFQRANRPANSPEWR